MIRYELYKLWRSRLLWGFLAAFLLINAVKIMQLSSSFQVNKQMNDARNRLYEEVRGVWDTEKLQFVIETQHRLEEQVTAGNYSTEPNQPGTYSGYLFGDYSLFTEIYDEMDYMVHYQSNNENLLAELRSNAEFFRKLGNDEDAEKNESALIHYQNRKIDAYYRTEGAVQWIHYPFSSLLMLLSVLLCTAPSFAKEHETKMDALLQTVKPGIVLLFFCTDCICFLIGFPMDCLQNPVYSISSMQDTPFSCSIGMYILLLYAFRLIPVMLFTVLVLLFSCLTKDELGTSVCALIALAGFMITGGTYHPLSLLSMDRFTADFQSVSFFGHPVLQSDLMLLAGIAELSAAILVFVLLQRKRGHHGRI